MIYHRPQHVTARPQWATASLRAFPLGYTSGEDPSIFFTYLFIYTLMTLPWKWIFCYHLQHFSFKIPLLTAFQQRDHHFFASRWRICRGMFANAFCTHEMLSHRGSSHKNKLQYSLFPMTGLCLETTVKEGNQYTLPGFF